MKEIRLIAFNRPHYLREVVDAVKAMRLAHEYHIVASVDRLPTGGHNADVVKICLELTDDVRLRDRLDCNGHVRLNFTEAFDAGVEELLYLEDDIVPAPDCLEFCRDHVPVLAAMPRVKCVCLLGDNQGDLFVAYRNRHAFRCQRWYTAWGNYWLRDGLAQALKVWRPSWDDSDNVTWDSRLNGQFIDNQWLSLTPFLSRTKNIGVVGRYCANEQQYKGRVRDFWSGSDFGKPAERGCH